VVCVGARVFVFFASTPVIFPFHLILHSSSHPRLRVSLTSISASLLHQCNTHQFHQMDGHYFYPLICGLSPPFPYKALWVVPLISPCSCLSAPLDCIP